MNSENQEKNIHDPKSSKREESNKKILILPPELRSDTTNVKTISPLFIRNKYLKVLKDREEKLKIIQKKRERIFNSELSGLVNKITKSKVGQDNSNETLDFNNLFPNVSKEEDNILFEFYQSTDTINISKKYLNIILKKYIDLTSYSLNLFDPESGCFYPILTQDLDEETSVNMLVERKDPILSETKDGIGRIEFSKKFIKNIFFRKKLSEYVLSRYSGFIYGFLNFGFTTAYLFIFFNKNSEPKREILQNLLNELTHKLKPILPLLNRELAVRFNRNSFEHDIVGKMYRYLKEYATKHQNFFVIHIKIENYFEVIGRIFLKIKVIDELKKIMNEHERLVDHQHDNIIYICIENREGDINKVLDEHCKNGFVYQVEIMKYKDDGKNLYTYY